MAGMFGCLVSGRLVRSLQKYNDILLQSTVDDSFSMILQAPCLVNDIGLAFLKPLTERPVVH